VDPVPVADLEWVALAVEWEAMVVEWEVEWEVMEVVMTHGMAAVK